MSSKKSSQKPSEHFAENARILREAVEELERLPVSDVDLVVPTVERGLAALKAGMARVKQSQARLKSLKTDFEQSAAEEEKG